MLSLSSSMAEINLLNCFRLSAITCSSSVCVEPMHSKLNSLKLFAKVRCARDKAESKKRKIGELVNLNVKFKLFNDPGHSRKCCPTKIITKNTKSSNSSPQNQSQIPMQQNTVNQSVHLEVICKSNYSNPEKTLTIINYVSQKANEFNLKFLKTIN